MSINDKTNSKRKRKIELFNHPETSDLPKLAKSAGGF